MGFQKMATIYSVPQLEKALQRRRLQLQKLMQQRNRLRKVLSRLEKRIVKVSGIAPDNRENRPRRLKNTKTLLETVTETLSRHGDGLTLKDLAYEVLASGYKTSSANFHNTLYQTLYHSADLAHDAKTHRYRLK
jgi:hypothetical protein